MCGRFIRYLPWSGSGDRRRSDRRKLSLCGAAPRTQTPGSAVPCLKWNERRAFRITPSPCFPRCANRLRRRRSAAVVLDPVGLDLLRLVPILPAGQPLFRSREALDSPIGANHWPSDLRDHLARLAIECSPSQPASSASVNGAGLSPASMRQNENKFLLVKTGRHRAGACTSIHRLVKGPAERPPVQIGCQSRFQGASPQSLNSLKSHIEGV